MEMRQQNSKKIEFYVLNKFLYKACDMSKICYNLKKKIFLYSGNIVSPPPLSGRKMYT